MSEREADVAAHYSTGSVLERITAALGQLGIDLAGAAPEDLKPVDEFHTGGLEATEALLSQLSIGPSTQVLDIGSGIGGTARAIAGGYGARVTGVDLTPEFVDAAKALTEAVGLGDRIEFHTGSALALPVQNGGFDLALMLHVGMNIPDKAGIFREAARVLRPDGVFAVFDVMRGPNPEELVFPLPWSGLPETSAVAAPADYKAAARAAGFELIAERDRAAFAQAFFQKVFAKLAADGPPPLGIHLLMGETAREKLANYVANMDAGRIAPTEMIFRLPS